ncbi:MAG: response regulator [Desulfosarcinaceae bacterium]|nr:response regulator [Desulfosarcinaceae bacterium]
MNKLTEAGLADPQAFPSASHPSADGRPTVLIVDDEPNILSALKRVLHHEPYHVLTTTSPMEALQLLATHSVQMVISDQRMPDMMGTELLLQVKLLYPDVVRVILTGYTDEEAIMAAINDGQVYKFLFKPWNSEALKLELYHALKYHEALAASRKNQACHQVLDQLPAPLVVIDAGDRLMRCNPAAVELFPGLQTRLAGQGCSGVWPEQVTEALSAARDARKPLWHLEINLAAGRYRVTGTRLAPGPAGSHWILLFQPLDLPGDAAIASNTSGI